MIPLSEPDIGPAEIASALTCLESGMISTAGSGVRDLEREIERSLGVSQAVATNSGTSALHLALLALRIGPDDEVVVPSVTFVATANVVRYVGAIPAFVDAEPEHWQIDARKLQRFLDDECDGPPGKRCDKLTGKTVRAVIPVHVLGHPCDMDAIRDAADEHGIAVIEDAAQAFGAKYRGRAAGAISRIGCISFNGNKTISAGGGGALLTNDVEIAERAVYLSTQARDNADDLVHENIGMNYRMTALHASVAITQVRRAFELVNARRRVADRYSEAFAVTTIQLQEEAEWAESARWLSAVRIPGGRSAVARSLKDAGASSRPLWQPMHVSPAHLNAPRVRCPVADRLYDEVLCLPSSSGLSEEDQGRVINAVLRAI